MTPARKRITDRFMIEILVRHKSLLVQERMKKDRMQDEVNRIIEEFTQKTGRQVSQMSVEEIDGKFKLKLEVM